MPPNSAEISVQPKLNAIAEPYLKKVGFASCPDLQNGLSNLIKIGTRVS
jgi:hypothetical protein